jgi:DNA polymerase
VNTLVLDFETRSELDIKTCGLDNYIAKSEPTCVAFALDDGPVELIDYISACPVCDNKSFACEMCCIISRTKKKFVASVRDSRITKVAHNLDFERAVLSKMGLETSFSEWIDTSVLARYAGLPAKLKQVCQVLKLGEDGKSDGSRLIKKFGQRDKRGRFRDKTTDPADWQNYLNYCAQDVYAERAVFRCLKSFMLPEREKRIHELDHKINRRGWPVDMKYVKAAHSAAAAEKAKLTLELKALTGLANPNSRDQFLGWAKTQGYEFESLGKAFVARMEKELELN